MKKGRFREAKRTFMNYEYSLIHISERFESDGTAYSISLVNAKELRFVLNGEEVSLSGRYLFCLSDTDVLKDAKWEYDVKTLSFLPYFYNVNLSTAIIDDPVYGEMREKYGYPDFYLFRERGKDYRGFIKLTESEYDLVMTMLVSAERNIGNHEIDALWSCRTRSDMIVILRIAEAAHAGKSGDLTNGIMRYIRENLKEDLSLPALCQRFDMNRTTLAETVKKLTGLTPGQYVLSERLGQSRPDLLFTRLTVEEVAGKYGFSDVNYYIRAFRKKYGVTPLQYRKSGFEKRISEEKRYHLKNGGTGLMTAEEFAAYLNAGLGLAVIRLRREPDKSRFLEPFRDYILTGKDCIQNHCFGFEDDLLSSFEESERVKGELLSALFSLDVPKPYHVLLMKRWSNPEQEKKLGELLGTVYEENYRRVCEAAEAFGDKSLFRLFDSVGNMEEKMKAVENPEIIALNELCLSYKNAFDALAAFDGSAEWTERLIEREAAMRKATGFFPSQPSCDVLFGLFHDKNPEIRAYMEANFPDDYYLKYDIHRIRRMTPSEIRKLDADFFMDEKNVGHGDLFNSEYLPDSVYSRVASELWNCEDPKKRIRLMWLFPERRRGVIPDEPDELLPELREAIEKAPRSYDTEVLARYVLSARHPEIKAYAAELIRKGDPQLIAYAIPSYFCFNYEKSDRELFAERLTAEESETKEYYRRAFLTAIEKGVPDLPLEVVPHVFRSFTCDYNSSRAVFISVLYQNWIYDENVTEEGLLDADARIRSYAVKMRDHVPYIRTRYLNAKNAGDYVRFFEKKEQTGKEIGIGLGDHMDLKEFCRFNIDPIVENKFYDHILLYIAARVKLMTEQRVEGFLAYAEGKPVGYIDCARRDFYQPFRWLPNAVKEDDIVVTTPVTFGDPHVAEALVRRAARFAEEEGKKAWAFLQRHDDTDEEWDALIALCRDAGLSVAAQGRHAPTQVIE